MSQSAFYDLAVIDNVPFGLTGSQGRFFALRLERPDWKSWAPGQFVMLRPQGWALDMPWARPFSICRVSTNELVIFFQVAGRGTEKMAKLRRGDKVHLWGPLGNRFAVEGGTPTLLLAGGIGIAPFVGYAERHPTPGVLSMVFGHRLPEDCYPVESLGERIDVESFHENTSEDLEWFLNHVRSRIEAYAERNGLVLACGPAPFLKAVQGFALAAKARCQLSLASRMACGVGACLGCVTKTTEKWPVEEKAGTPVQTCTHGPVFWADQITLEA